MKPKQVKSTDLLTGKKEYWLTGELMWKSYIVKADSRIKFAMIVYEGYGVNYIQTVKFDVAHKITEDSLITHQALISPSSIGELLTAIVKMNNVPTVSLRKKMIDGLTIYYQETEK